MKCKFHGVGGADRTRGVKNMPVLEQVVKVPQYRKLLDNPARPNFDVGDD